MKHPILYLDDEQANLDAFRMVFGGSFKVMLARNVSEALNYLKSTEITVLISDQRMPEKTGLEFITEVNELFPNVVCMILTAYSDISIALQAINQGGVYRFLMKPWDENEMKIAIVNAIDKHNLLIEKRRLFEDLQQKNIELEAYNEELIVTTEALKESNTQIQQINEELIIAKEKAEESEKLKTAFLANLSHEIRTPLNAIIGFSDLLCHPNITTDKLNAYAFIIKQRSSDLLSLINDIIDLSKIESKQLKINESILNVNNLILELYDFFKKQNEILFKKTIELSFKNFLQHQQHLIKADSMRIKQILMNLISNAYKFTHSGKIEFGCYIIDVDLVFYVKDSGIGISENKQTIIFERFRQVEESYLSKEYGGAGLGLSICKGLLELMKGKIWVDSKIGEGSTFYFSVPYIPSRTETEIEIPVLVEEPKKSSKKVLVVEDDHINLLLIIELLSHNQVEILKAENGKTALKLYEQNPDIEIILIDIRMPDMNGFEVTKKIRMNRKNIAIIAQTAYASHEDKIKCLEAGCNDIITKPINSENFYKVMNKYL